jgi:hypothetical protein
MRPARIHPPTRPNTSRNADTMIAAGKKTIGPRPWSRKTLKKRLSSKVPIRLCGVLRRRNTHAAASSRAPVSMTNPA